MEDGLAEAIDDGKVGPRDDPKIRGKFLVDEFGWDKELAKKIWAFGALSTPVYAIECTITLFVALANCTLLERSHAH